MGVVWQHVREVEEYDLSGKIVVPGFFDMHVHFREPGQTHKEDIQTGSLAAAYSGFTGVLCMPNTRPPIDTAELVKANIEKAKNNIIDIYSSACVTRNRDGMELTDIESLINAGAIAITDDGSPVWDEELMINALKRTGNLGKPLIQHCEVMERSGGGVMNKGEISRMLGVKNISNISEYECIKRDIGLVRKLKDCHYHVQHISTKEGVKLVRKAKKEGLNVTAEVCPHHFILTEKAVLTYGTNAKMNPPLRTEADVEEIKRGLSDGTIDIICTDHAPHTESEKALGLEKAPFGIVGLETSFGLTYTYLVEKGIITFEQMITKMSDSPRKLLGLKQIKIQEGEPANLTILNLNAEWKVDISKFHSKSKNSPFDRWALKGKPAGIINNQKHLIYE